MGVRKKLYLLTLTVLAVSVFSCGGDGGGSSSSNSSGLSEIEKTVASPEVKEAKVGNESLKVVPTPTTVVKDNYAQTSSAVGVIVPVEFGSGEKISNSTETAENVTDVLEDENIQKQFFNAKPPYVVASAKTVKKPIRSADGKLAVLVDFDSLPMDMTAALANYQTILAIPDNSFTLLKEGYIPYTYYSGDIAFYDSNGKRVWDSSIFSGTNLKIYAVIPQDETSNETFGEGGNYTLLLLNPKTGYPYSSKEIKVAKKDNTSLTLEAVIDENHLVPFVIAKQDSGEIASESGGVDVPYSINLKAGIVYTNKDGKAVGFGKISGDSYESYYVKSWLSDNETYPHAAVVSYILKDGKYELDNYTGGDITIPASAFDPTYVMVDNMTDTDKEMLKCFKQNIYPYGGYLYDDLYIENSCPSGLSSAGGCEDYENLISSFLNGEISNATKMKETYASEYANCTVVNQQISESFLALDFKCVLTSSGNETNEYKLSISKEGENRFKVSEFRSENYSWVESYSEENATESYKSSRTLEVSYVLVDEGDSRRILDHLAIVSYSGSSGKKNGDGKILESKEFSGHKTIKFYERKPGEYLAYVNISKKENASYGNSTYSLSYDIEETEPLYVSGDSVSDGSLTAVVKNVQFSSTPPLPHNISSSSKLIFTPASSYDFYVNMSKEPLSSIASGYECEFDELLYSAASSNSTEVEGQVTSE